MPGRDAGARPQRGSILLRVVLFSLALTLVFTLVANMLPQIEGEVPEETAVDLSTLDMDGFIALGERIFREKGTCTLCHNNLGRAPDILELDMAALSLQRLQDERYRGTATDVAGYLRESMLEPDAFVVAGFGKKGTSDAESPMPAVDAAPILLNEVEIEAVIAYMQAKDGNEVTVAIPSELPAAEPAAAPAPVAAAPAAADNAEAALAKYACTACHSVAGSQSPVGPDLNGIGDRLDPEAIRQSIIDPDAVIAEGFVAGMMPADFASKMTVSELQLMVDYLVGQKAGN